VRFSFGSANAEQDVHTCVEILRRIFSSSR